MTGRPIPACAGMEEVMFPDAEYDSYEADVEYAKSFCARCPFMADRSCLMRALRNNERFGVWGGTSQEERAEMVRELRRLAKQEKAA